MIQVFLFWYACVVDHQLRQECINIIMVSSKYSRNTVCPIPNTIHSLQPSHVEKIQWQISTFIRKPGPINLLNVRCVSTRVIDWAGQSTPRGRSIVKGLTCRGCESVTVCICAFRHMCPRQCHLQAVLTPWERRPEGVPRKAPRLETVRRSELMNAFESFEIVFRGSLTTLPFRRRSHGCLDKMASLRCCRRNQLCSVGKSSPDEGNPRLFQWKLLLLILTDIRMWPLDSVGRSCSG